MIRDKYPVVYMESMNTVLCQECIRYNRLTDVIRDNLLKLRKAIVGLVVMSADLDAVANDMFINKIPAGWLSNSYPSLKPLGSYISDLAERLNFLKEWIANGPPTVTWFSGLFFSQSFLTGALQNYARKHKLPIDSISFEVVFMGDGEITQKSPKPADGVYTNGLFLEGARWEYSTMQLAESLPKILFSPAPMMWLKPNKTAEIVEYPSYRCPVYREGSRRGTLSTSGHSTNFVMNVKMPTDHDPSHWVLRGVAMITQLAD
jgi:dynein heavy chain